MINERSAESATQLPFHLTINDLSEQIFRWSRSKMYEFLADDDHDFPGPALIAGRQRLWSRGEVLAWVSDNRPADRTRRAAVAEQTRQRAATKASVRGAQHEGRTTTGSGLLAGFTPASGARRAA